MPKTATKKKTAAKKAPAKKVAASSGDAALGKQIASMRDEGQSWADIADTLEIKPGKAMFLHMCATVKPSEKITFKDDADLAKKVVAARDKENLSWGTIMARTGLSGGKLRQLYEEASGTSTLGQRIGKGGRPPGSGNGAAGTKPKGAAKKGAARATKTASKKRAGAAKKGAAKSSGELGPGVVGDDGEYIPLANLRLGELKDRLEDQVIGIRTEHATRLQKFRVARVIKTNDGVATLKQAENGAIRDVILAHVASVGKR